MKKGKVIFLKKRLLAFLCIIYCLPLSGCFGNYEVSNLAILMAIGIDKTDDNQILLSGEVFKPGTISGGYQSQSVGPKSSTMIITAKGSSIYSALNQFSSILPKSLYWSHLQAVIIGESMAKEGTAHILDTFVREPDLRRNIKVYITRGKASSILAKTPKMAYTLGGEISQITDFSRFQSNAFASNVAEILAALSSNTKDPYTGALGTVPSKNVTIQSMKPKSIRLSGIAVLKRDRLMGWLDSQQATDLLWLKGETVRRGLIMLPCEQNPHKQISFRLLSSSSRIEPEYHLGKPKIQVNLDTSLEMTEMNCSGFHLNDQTVNHLNERLESQIKSHLKQTLTILKNKWQTDPMGFGEVIYHHNPQLWRKLKKGWNNGGLRNLPVTINVSVEIKQNGLQQSTIKNRGGENQ